MILLFYILWSLAIVRVLLAPLFTVARKGLWLGVVLIGIWVLVGTVTYQSFYLQNQEKKKEFEAKKDTILVEQKKLEKLYKSHPTSRDLVLELANLSYQFGEHEKLLQYVSELRAIDPNNPKVEKFLQEIQ
ncbi:MAG: hypothetical protein ABI758_03085 [Candidatus Woesebacteria bacterium]